MKKKIILKRQYKNANGEIVEQVEEITSDSEDFKQIFSEITELHNKMASQVFDFDIFKITWPSDN